MTPIDIVIHTMIYLNSLEIHVRNIINNLRVDGYREMVPILFIFINIISISENSYSGFVEYA